MTALLAVAAWLLLALFVYLLRRPRRDDLMAVANATKVRCHHIGRASMPDHLWHECHLHPRHVDVDPMHRCRCGTYWRRAAHETQQIDELAGWYAAPTYEEHR